jgi:hypothetical protein
MDQLKVVDKKRNNGVIYLAIPISAKNFICFFLQCMLTTGN